MACLNSKTMINSCDHLTMSVEELTFALFCNVVINNDCTSRHLSLPIEETVTSAKSSLSLHVFVYPWSSRSIDRYFMKYHD
jgi:hypothetical protein